MSLLDSNSRRVKDLSPIGISFFIVGRVLVALGIGILAMAFFRGSPSSCGAIDRHRPDSPRVSVLWLHPAIQAGNRAIVAVLGGGRNP